MPLPIVARAYRFVRGDGGLTITVAILALFLFAVYPMAEVGAIAKGWLDVAFGVFLIACATLFFEPRPLVRALLVLLVLAVVSRLAEYHAPSRALATIDSTLVMVLSLALGALFLQRATRDGRINMHRIMGACGSFLMLGLVFSQAYRLLALYLPHSFAVGGTPADASAIEHRFTYFSFITLTSTGYGDVTPVHPYVRSLATFEAIVGQLYIAVLIARLIGLEIEWRRVQRDEASQRDSAPDR